MEVPGRKAGKMSASTMQATQEDFEWSCDPCGMDGHKLPATGFCVDCQHYLCEACYKCHCRPMPMKNHALLDKSEMPYEKTTAKPKDMCTEKCPQHKGKSVKYICPSNDQLGCSVCMTTSHRGCDNVSYIDDIAEGIENSDEYKNLISKLETINKRFDKNKCKTGQNSSQTKMCYARAIEDIQTRRNEVNRIFDKLENEVKKEAKHIQDSDTEKMNNVSATCNMAIQEIQALNTEMEKLRKYQQNTQLFIKIKKAEKNMKALGDDLSKVENENQTRRYKFVPDPQMQDLLRSINVLGQLKNPKDLKPIQIQDINVKSTSDERSQCYITGSEILADGRLVIIDCVNTSVKLMDTKQNKIISQIQVPAIPWDITETNTDEVAVTLPDKKAIQFVSVSDSSLSIGREVKVDGKCWGIVCYGDRLAVAFTDPPKVEIMEKNGTVLNLISTNTNGDRLFFYSCYIAISPDRTTLYVSDGDNNSLTSMTMEGVVRAVYKDKDLTHPAGVCVDSVGTVYLCGYKSDNVHQITENCERLRILLKRADGVDGPYSISYSDQEDKLYLGRISNTMKVFELK